MASTGSFYKESLILGIIDAHEKAITYYLAHHVQELTFHLLLCNLCKSWFYCL